MAKRSTPKPAAESSIEVLTLTTTEISFAILGGTPFIANRMSSKAQHQLLMPSGRKSTAERATSLKHDPYTEFRGAPYLDDNPKSPTYLQHLSSAFKRALCDVAVDLPGATKAQLGRLTWVCGERVALYGKPYLHMSITRSADVARTPDVRTRAILPRWACFLHLTFIRPQLSEQAVSNLLAAAGLLQGVGDWRQSKGSGNFGQFSLVSVDDERFQQVLQEGREIQIEAMENPTPYDSETEELLSWYGTETKRRGIEVAR